MGEVTSLTQCGHSHTWGLLCEDPEAGRGKPQWRTSAWSRGEGAKQALLSGDGAGEALRRWGWDPGWARGGL